MTSYPQLCQMQLMVPASQLKSSWDVWSRVTMYPGRSQKSFKEKLDPEGHDSKSVTPEIKDFYWEAFKDAVMSKITSASQLVDESGESRTIDFSMIYMDEVGGVKKACIYGPGSQATFYENIGSLSASTAQPQDCDFDARVKEYVKEMKEEMKEHMREEIQHELREEMKH